MVIRGGNQKHQTLLNFMALLLPTFSDQTVSTSIHSIVKAPLSIAPRLGKPATQTPAAGRLGRRRRPCVCRRASDNSSCSSCRRPAASWSKATEETTGEGAGGGRLHLDRQTSALGEFVHFLGICSFERVLKVKKCAISIEMKLEAGCVRWSPAQTSAFA